MGEVYCPFLLLCRCRRSLGEECGYANRTNEATCTLERSVKATHREDAFAKLQACSKSSTRQITRGVFKGLYIKQVFSHPCIPPNPRTKLQQSDISRPTAASPSSEKPQPRLWKENPSSSLAVTHYPVAFSTRVTLDAQLGLLDSLRDDIPDSDGLSYIC